jgi:hypothetical protein
MTSAGVSPFTLYFGQECPLLKGAIKNGRKRYVITEISRKSSGHYWW